MFSFNAQNSAYVYDEYPLYGTPGQAAGFQPKTRNIIYAGTG